MACNGLACLWCPVMHKGNASGEWRACDAERWALSVEERNCLRPASLLPESICVAVGAASGQPGAVAAAVGTGAVTAAAG